LESHERILYFVATIKIVDSILIIININKNSAGIYQYKHQEQHGVDHIVGPFLVRLNCTVNAQEKSEKNLRKDIKMSCAVRNAENSKYDNAIKEVETGKEANLVSKTALERINHRLETIDHDN